LQPFAQASIEYQDPNILTSTASPIEQIFRSRENADLEQFKAERDKAKTAQEKKKFLSDQEDKLISQREGNKTTQRTDVMREAIKKIETSGNRATGAGDLALIFNYMKMLDPNSVVRESEFRSAADARSFFSRQVIQDENGNYTTKSGAVLPAFLVQAFQKADPDAKGAFLLPEQRKEFVNSAGELYEGQLEVQMGEDQKIIDRAKDREVDYRKVVGRKTAQEELEERRKAREEASNEPPKKAIIGRAKAIELSKNPEVQAELEAWRQELAAAGEPPPTPEEEIQAVKMMLDKSGIQVDINIP
jgi:hypothetical protein